MRYLENTGVNLRDYADKVKKICKTFHLTFEDGAFKRTLGEYETNQTFTQLTSFIVGISQISTVHRV